MRSLVIIGLVCLLGGGISAGQNEFGQAKRELAREGCHSFDFLSIVESDVFDVVDTAEGSAYISSDGRYLIEVADEVYLYDLEHSYTYSESSGQVIVEKADEATDRGEEFSFILKLDELYESGDSDIDDQYRLVKRAGASDAYPDSLTVVLDRKQSRIARLEFYDLNDELNRIVIQNQTYKPECDTLPFVPDFPETAEVIKL